MSLTDIILALTIVVPWNLFLIYRMKKEQKK